MLVVSSYHLSPKQQAPLCSSGQVLETQLGPPEQKGNLVTFGTKLRKKRMSS